MSFISGAVRAFSTSTTMTTRELKVNPVASIGFGHKNDFYNANRPSYPSSVLSHIHQSITKKNKDDLNIVELGSGTGIFSRLVLSPPEGYPKFPIKSFTALEPSSGMRDSFNRNVIPSVDAPVVSMEGTFTQFPESVQDGTVDACLIAQAFHWAHPEYAEAAKTIGRSLKPHNGQLVFIWNSESLSVPWIKTFRDTYEVYDGHSPQQRFKLWHALYDTPEYKTLFDPPVFTVWNSKSPCTKEIAINRVMSKSYTSVLSKEESEALISKLEQVLDSAEDMVWIDKEKGVFEYNYETDVVIMNRK